MSIADIHDWTVALHHTQTRVKFARKTESVGAWLRSNMRCVAEGIPDNWIAVGIAPTPREAADILDRFQEELAG
jgi:hypothetical protein